jgi:hypothetical protein
VTERQPLAATGTLHGVSVERTSLDEAVSVFVRGVVGETPAQTHRLVNAYTFALADRDPAYQDRSQPRGLTFRRSVCFGAMTWRSPNLPVGDW